MLKRNSISTITGDRGGNERFGNFYERKKRRRERKKEEEKKNCASKFASTLSRLTASLELLIM